MCYRIACKLHLVKTSVPFLHVSPCEADGLPGEVSFETSPKPAIALHDWKSSSAASRVAYTATRAFVRSDT